VLVVCPSRGNSRKAIGWWSDAAHWLLKRIVAPRAGSLKSWQANFIQFGRQQPAIRRVQLLPHGGKM
jgi:hypothetical protein